MVDAPPASFTPTGARSRSFWDELDLLNILNGTGIPERAAALNELLNPLAAIPRAQAASQELFAPNRSTSERVASLGQMLGEVAGVAAPMAGGVMAGRPAINALAEGLTGVQTTAGNALADAGDVGRQFYVDESGALRLWHGSPHDFDRFSLDKIGTGAGQQAYGKGLYFSESANVADGYRKSPDLNIKIGDQYVSSADPRSATIISDTLLQNGVPANVADMVAGYIKRQNPLEMPLSIVDKAYPSIAPKVRALLKNETYSGPKSGKLYEVAIDANPEDFLEYDTSIGAQSPAVSKYFREKFGPDFDMTGGGALQQMDMAIGEASGVRPPVTGFSPALTDELKGAGVKGISFNRGGARNYVVFDDRLVNILGKDGQRTTPEGRAQTILDMLQSGRASEVTDDMLDLGDPVANARLNQYLYRNYDLPMDEASRMQRAGEMGFDTGTPMYHGTASDFTGFDLSKVGSGAGGKESAVFASNSPNVASLFADQAQIGSINSPSVMPLTLGGSSLPADFGGNFYNGDAVQRTIDHAKSLGFDSITAKNLGESFGDGKTSFDDQLAIFDPRNIRSRFARFDPRLSHLKNLSAGVAGVGIGGAALAPQDAQAGVANGNALSYDANQSLEDMVLQNFQGGRR